MKRLAFPIFILAIAVLFGACHSKKDGEKKKFGSKQKDIIQLYNMADSIYYNEKRIDTAAC
jgi:outer membrane protein assembly factor BamD (BamD/ComL family)